MKFVITLYRRQLNAARVFLHEHPSHATSWSLREVQLLAREQVVKESMLVLELDAVGVSRKLEGKIASEKGRCVVCRV